MDGVKGQRKKPQSETERPTEDRQIDYEDLAYDLLSTGHHKYHIKREFKERYGLSARTVEKYLSRARERMLQNISRTKEELRAESVAFYESLGRESGSKVWERVKARERIDKLLGLDAPIKTALTDPTGENEYAGLSDTELNARILAAVAKGDERGIPSSAGAEGGEEGISGG